MARFLIGVGICALLSGCATTPVSYSEAVPVPAERVLAADLINAKPGTGRVTIARDSGFMGAACTYRVFLDGRPIALLRNGERVDVYVEPGDHVLGTRTDGLCGGGTAETGAQVSNGQWKRYRISSGQDGTVQLSPTAF